MSDENINYDEEPVVYCTKCYSLKIKYEETIDSDCCMDCGSTETAETSIHQWEELYKQRYGHKYIEKGNPRNSLYFTMPLKKLRDLVYHCKLLPFIIKRFYPEMPKGLTKTEAINVLFNKLNKENQLDDLRYLLYNYYKK